MAGLGEEFRAAREARHLSLSDVSEQIHIRAVYLQSIEDEDWSAIAAPVYVRGFIRTYARFLGLPGEQAVAVFNDSIGASAKQNEASAASPRRGPSIWLYVAGLAALILVGFVGYNYYVFQQQATPATTAGALGGAAGKAAANAGAAAGNMAGSAGSAAANAVATGGANAGNMAGTAGDAIGAGGAAVASAAPADGTATPAAADAKKPRTLEVHVTQASWLLVKIDGAQKLEGIFPAGTTKEFHGNTVRIRAGNAGGVNLTVNGKELGSMGPSGAVVDRTIGLAEE